MQTFGENYQIQYLKRVYKKKNVQQKSIIPAGRIVLVSYILLLKEASLENYAAAINLAVNFLRILSQTDASNLCTTLDDH